MSKLHIDVYTPLSRKFVRKFRFGVGGGSFYTIKNIHTFKCSHKHSALKTAPSSKFGKKLEPEN